MTQIAQSIPKRRPGSFSRLSLFVGAGVVVSLLVSVPFLLRFQFGRVVVHPASGEYRPSAEPLSSTNVSDSSERIAILAFSLKPIPPEVAARLGNSRGGLISEVAPDGPAFRSGLRTGDVLVGVGSLSIPDCALLKRCLDRLPASGTISLTVIRDRQERHILVVLPPGPTESR
jgi:S1-C subfamily serine protease